MGGAYCDSSCVHGEEDGLRVQADEDMVERINGYQEVITRKVGEVRAEVTGQEVRHIVRREVVNALVVRNVSKTPQSDVKNIIVQQNI